MVREVGMQLTALVVMVVQAVAQAQAILVTVVLAAEREHLHKVTMVELLQVGQVLAVAVVVRVQ